MDVQTRPALLLWSVIVTAVLLNACSPDRVTEPPPGPLAPPNIVLFLVDDLRHDSPGFAGHPFFQSPQMDRLASEGVMFEDAFVISSLCSPSRATMLTGRYTHEHGVTNIWTDLPLAEVTFAELLQAQGYETAWIGKWHLNRFGKPHAAFDHWVSYPVHGAYFDPVLNVNGELETTTGHLTDQLTRHALDYLQRPHDQPFFLAVSHSAVHVPYLAQPRFAGLYAGATVDLPSTWDTGNPGKPFFLDCREVTTSEEVTRELIRDYFDLLAGVDESLGLILDALESTGVLDNTLFVFASDNGYMLGEHSMLSKGAAYEASMRIPLVARFPRWFEAGQRVSGNLALNLDLPASFLAAAGIGLPPTMRGVSLRELANGSVQRDEFLYEYSFDPGAPQTPDIRALRTLDYKYVQYPGGFEPEEVYDLHADPDEADNLATRDEFSGVTDSLRVRLEKLRSALGANSTPSPRADDAWMARAFVNVVDPLTGQPIPKAAISIDGDLAMGSPTRAGDNGRWYACMKTSRASIEFQLLSVRANGYVVAGPFPRVQLRAGDSEVSLEVSLVKLPFGVEDGP